MGTADPLDQALAREQLRQRLPRPELRRLLRTSAGVTQTALAQTLGVTPASISRWESGARRPGPDMLVRYLGALDRLARARGTTS